MIKSEKEITARFTSKQKTDWQNATAVWKKNKGQPVLIKMLAVLRDYTKDDSTFMRFFTGHPNRQYVPEFNKIIAGKYDDAFDLLYTLKKFRRGTGTSATYIDLIEYKLRASLEKAKINYQQNKNNEEEIAKFGTAFEKALAEDPFNLSAMRVKLDNINRNWAELKPQLRK